MILYQSCLRETNARQAKNLKKFEKTVDKLSEFCYNKTPPAKIGSGATDLENETTTKSKEPCKSFEVRALKEVQETVILLDNRRVKKR